MNKKSPKKILIRTEASPEIGMGHLMRCLSLTNMLKDDFEVSFLLNHYNKKAEDLVTTEGMNCHFLDNATINEDEFYETSDVVVLDGYRFKEEAQKKIKQKGKVLVFIDDLNDQHFYADAIINVSDSVSEKGYEIEPNTKLYLGSQYALLRSEFIEAAKIPARKIIKVNAICVSMGGADANNVTLKVLNAIQNISSVAKVFVIVGAMNPHEKSLQDHLSKSTINISLHKGINAKEMVRILSECELMICPASGTSLEAAAVGIGMISGTTATNQSGILKGLENKKCLINAGDLNLESANSMAQQIEECISNPELVNGMIAEQKKLIDGLSPDRINLLFKQLVNEN